MAIIKTTTATRTDASIPFYPVAGRAAFEAGDASVLPQYQSMYPTLKAMIDDGTYQVSVTFSEDGLTETRVLTYADLATLSRAETAFNIGIFKEFQNYKSTNNFVMPNASNMSAEERGALLKLEGIDAPYTVTTTYTFPSASDAYIDTLIGSLENYEHFGKLTDLVINGADVIVTHQYLNSADQTANPFLDAFFITQLAEKGVTRTIHYAMV